MEVLITTKTKKGYAACVGGLVLENNRYVRLINPDNWYQKTKIGDIWDIEFHDRKDVVPPHIEDVIIESKRFVRKLENISEFIINSGVKIYKGQPEGLFDGKLIWTRFGSGFIDKNYIPKKSIEFWISDKDLTLDKDNKHYSYIRDISDFKDFTDFIYQSQFGYVRRGFYYVGSEKKVKKIPAGTLLIVSLARWWKPNNSNDEKRCYLQLSGWYEIKNESEK